MKKNKFKYKYRVNLDKLEIAYTCDENIKNVLEGIEKHQKFGEYEIVRDTSIKNNFKYNFRVIAPNIIGDERPFLQFATLSFGSNNQLKEPFVYCIINNRSLYNGWELSLIHDLTEQLHFTFNHFSRLDIAFDVSMNRNPINKFYKVLKNETVTPIILRKSFEYMDERVEALMTTCSGSRNNPLENKAVYLQNSDKTFVLNIYNKKLELEESNKHYILKGFNKDKGLFRFEVRTKGNVLEQSLQKLNLTTEDLYYFNLTNSEILLKLYIKLIERMIIFEDKNTK